MNQQPERRLDSRLYTTAQRHELLRLVAANLLYKDIRLACEAFSPPFSPHRRVVEKYRQSAGVKVADLMARGELTALNTGLALREVRVAKLQRLARKMERDLFHDDKLWTDDAKTVAKDAYHYKLFNRAEVDAYRGLLDDIAREVGGRVAKVEVEEKRYVVKPAPDARDVTATAEVVEVKAE